LIVLAAEIPKAEKFAQAQRFAGAKLLAVDESKLWSDESRALVEKVTAAAAKGPKEYDAALANPKVAALFALGALHFNSADRAAITNAKRRTQSA